MELANCTLTLDDIGNQVELQNVTPPEAVIHIANRKHIGKPVLTRIKLTGKDNRSIEDERARLRQRFIPKMISTPYPGENPALPTTFKEAGIEVEVPKEKLETKDYVKPSILAEAEANT